MWERDVLDGCHPGQWRRCVSSSGSASLGIINKTFRSRALHSAAALSVGECTRTGVTGHVYGAFTVLARLAVHLLSGGDRYVGAG